MADIRKVVENRLTGREIESPSLSDVKKTTEDFKAIDATIDAARKLAGVGGLEGELERKEKRLSELERENRSLESRMNQAYMDSVKSEIGGRIEHLESSLKAGANQASLKEQVKDIKEAMTVLGQGNVGDEVDTLSKLMRVLKEMKGDQGTRSLSEQVKEAKQALDLLKPDTQGVMQNMPHQLALQITQLNTQVQLQIEQMKDERDRRDKEFQLEVMKFQDERDLRRKEVESKLQIEQERNQFLADGIERLGSVIADAAAERGAKGGGGGIQKSTRTVSGVVEAGMGEFGEIQCRRCGSKVSIAADAVQTMCPKCSSLYSIERVALESALAKEAEQTDITEEMDETWQRGVR